jgi:hypothetical protein
MSVSGLSSWQYHQPWFIFGLLPLREPFPNIDLSSVRTILSSSTVNFGTLSSFHSPLRDHFPNVDLSLAQAILCGVIILV